MKQSSLPALISGVPDSAGSDDSVGLDASERGPAVLAALTQKFRTLGKPDRRGIMHER